MPLGSTDDDRTVRRHDPNPWTTATQSRAYVTGESDARLESDRDVDIEGAVNGPDLEVGRVVLGDLEPNRTIDGLGIESRPSPAVAVELDLARTVLDARGHLPTD